MMRYLTAHLSVTYEKHMCLHSAGLTGAKQGLVPSSIGYAMPVLHMIGTACWSSSRCRPTTQRMQEDGNCPECLRDVRPERLPCKGQPTLYSLGVGPLLFGLVVFHLEVDQGPGYLQPLLFRPERQTERYGHLSFWLILQHGISPVLGLIVLLFPTDRLAQNQVP